ncbi:hypothetical protein GUITHDRAFT_99441 [Guillardia theta CCMP2712]|uniref:Uncharacterized protein n=1 Tax=Guillardia theta (strain CCMP2712) TaxID=905079 RepID=L1K2Y4_GUITC|nr:hypothetical protein GUITHDRAFT_99441 [Guillardia theta CCMP2712]EKX54790.1 hypothetical protein GUITHDRAFT_99441 [Guillardia theta CCMP2712]|eukprot:XP_005841770.1 hypothetical protein GUITHDRAFT_99441 [Guillardia theta CCMP2712]
MSHDSEQIECTLIGESDFDTRSCIHAAAGTAAKLLKLNLDLPEATWEDAAHATHQQPAKCCKISIPESLTLRRSFLSLFQVEALDNLEELSWRVLTCCSPSSHGRKPPDGLDSESESLGEGANYLLMRSKSLKGSSSKHPPILPTSQTEKENPLQNEFAGEDTTNHNLPLPEVIQKLVKENDVLRWDNIQKCYQVLDGERFKERFNQLREIRQKHKDGAVERPFSRMHNFYILERGEKWAKTGTTFRPKHPQYAPKGCVITMEDCNKQRDPNASTWLGFAASSRFFGSMSLNGQDSMMATATALQALGKMPIPVNRKSTTQSS